MKTVILTGSEARHTFFRKALSFDDNISVLASYCEQTRGNQQKAVAAHNSQSMQDHLDAREHSEQDFFGHFNTLTPEDSNPTQIDYGDINSSETLKELQSLSPDVIVTYGCSILRQPLLDAFPGRIMNIHLGLSPYYRGSGSNFFPLVNGEPEYVGATFMYISAGIDEGEIIHQIRARFHKTDTPHSVGNRLIADMAGESLRLLERFRDLAAMPQPPSSASDKLYKRKDFTPEATKKMYTNFEQGMIAAYLSDREKRDAAAPLVTNAALT